MAVGDYFQWLRGTLRTAFKIGKADLDSSGLSAARTLTLQDRDGIVALDKFVISTKNSNFSAGATSGILYECDVSGGNVTATLTGASAGTTLGFKLTVAPGGNKLLFSVAIDGNSSVELTILHAWLFIMYDGTNWKIVDNGQPGASTLYGTLDALTVTGANIASATTTDIGAATGESITITGTTTITGLGTKASGCLRFVTFSGALILTHNAASLILPTGANITTAADDTAIFLSLGAGNWRCISYTPKTANLPVTVVKTQVFTASGTYTPDANMVYCVIEAVGGGGAGGGNTGSSSHTTTGGGGGAGAYSRKVSTKAAIGASQTVTIGAGGTGVLNGNGNAGGDTSIGSICVAKGGSGGNVGSSGAFGTGGAGGLASGGTGDFKSNGNSGQGGLYSTSNGIYCPTASGGSSVFGGMGITAFTSGGASTNGTAGTEYGAGGSGSQSVFVGTNRTGGDGFKGAVIITEFCTK